MTETETSQIQKYEQKDTVFTRTECRVISMQADTDNNPDTPAFGLYIAPLDSCTSTIRHGETVVFQIPTINIKIRYHFDIDRLFSCTKHECLHDEQEIANGADIKYAAYNFIRTKRRTEFIVSSIAVYAEHPNFKHKLATEDMIYDVVTTNLSEEPDYASIVRSISKDNSPRTKLLIELYTRLDEMNKIKRAIQELHDKLAAIDKK